MSGPQVPGIPTRPRDLPYRARRVLATQPGAVVVFPPIRPVPEPVDELPIAAQAAEAVTRGGDLPPVPPMPYLLRLEPGDLVWIGPGAGPEYRERFLFHIEHIEASGWRGWIRLTGTRRDDDSRQTLVVFAPGLDLWQRAGG